MSALFASGLVVQGETDDDPGSVVGTEFSEQGVALLIFNAAEIVEPNAGARLNSAVFVDGRVAKEISHNDTSLLILLPIGYASPIAALKIKKPELVRLWLLERSISTSPSERLL